MPTERDDTRAERAAAWRRAHHEELDDTAALAFHVRASWGLERALRILEAAHVPVLVVKGAILAHLLYESPIERPLRDVDLRVCPADLRRATRALLADPGARQLVSSRVYGSTVVSLRGVEIDLESTIGPRFVCATSVHDMLARAEHATEPLGFAHVRPDLSDHALLLAINSFKDHVLPNTGTVEDLVRIARRPEFVGERFAERVAQAGVTTIVHVVARYIAETRLDPRWGELADRIVPRRRGHAERVLATLRGRRRPSELVIRLEARAAADGRLRLTAALGAAVVREVALVSGDYVRRALR